MDYMRLKSGTDVRGVAIETAEGGPVTLTDEAVIDIARAFLVWCEKQIGRASCRERVS